MCSRSTFAVLALSVALSGNASAQQAATRVPEAAERSAPAASSTAAIDFPGGTLSEYVAHVKSRYRNANIVTDADVGTVRVSRATLPEVTLPVALQWVLSGTDARMRNVALRIARDGREVNAVFVFTYSIVPPRGQPADDHVVKTYHLPAPVEGERGVEGTAIAQAINEALNKQRSATKGTADYRPATRSLIVEGPRSAIVIADRAFEDMTRAARIAAALPRMQAEIDRLRAELNELKKTPRP